MSARMDAQPTNRRKEEAIDVIRSDAEADRRRRHFDSVRLIHRALPEIHLSDVDPSIEFLGRRLSFPLLISSMTGGDSDRLRTINRNLATAAEMTGVAMGVGSQRVMFENRAARESFELRDLAPNALLFANLGAVQLNCGFTTDHCQAAVEVVGADALVLHCNPLQEAIQPEGDTLFGGVISKIAAVVEQLPVPVVIKEVGAGVSAPDVEALMRAGVRIIDVAGSGGLSWSRIEGHRRAAAGLHDGLGAAFQDWGIPTPDALRALRRYRGRLVLIASGGIRSGVDMVKAMVLGATMAGMAHPFLEPAMESAERVVDVIAQLKREFMTAMWLLGIDRAQKLIANDALLLGPRPAAESA